MSTHITSASHVHDTHSILENQRISLHLVLRNWETQRNQGIGENRTEAVKRIMRAYFNDYRDVSINLEGLQLTSLPSHLSQINHLRELKLKGNPNLVLPKDFGGIGAQQPLYALELDESILKNPNNHGIQLPIVVDDANNRPAHFSKLDPYSCRNVVHEYEDENGNKVIEQFLSPHYHHPSWQNKDQNSDATTNNALGNGASDTTQHTEQQASSFNSASSSPAPVSSPSATSQTLQSDTFSPRTNPRKTFKDGRKGFLQKNADLETMKGREARHHIRKNGTMGDRINYELRCGLKGLANVFGRKKKTAEAVTLVFENKPLPSIPMSDIPFSSPANQTSPETKSTSNNVHSPNPRGNTVSHSARISSNDPISLPEIPVRTSSLLNSRQKNLDHPTYSAQQNKRHKSLNVKNANFLRQQAAINNVNAAASVANSHALYPQGLSENGKATFDFFTKPNTSHTRQYPRHFNQVMAYKNGITSKVGDLTLETDPAYIEWLFPTDWKNDQNPTAPFLNAEDFIILRENPTVMERLEQGFNKLLNFYGLQWDEQTKNVEIMNPLPSNSQTRWSLNVQDHNNLRFTRIIRSMHLFGRTDKAVALLNCLGRIGHKILDQHPQLSNAIIARWQWWQYQLNRPIKSTSLLVNTTPKENSPQPLVQNNTFIPVKDPHPLQPQSPTPRGNLLGLGNKNLFDAPPKHIDAQEHALSKSKVLTPNVLERRQYKNDTVDVRKVASALETSHQRINISGGNNNCWWRAAWLSVLVQRDPGELRDRIVAILGEQHRKNANSVFAMASAAQNNISHVLAQSKLRLPSETDKSNPPKGEDALSEITYALMLRGGINETEALESVIGNDMGDAMQIFTLTHQLGADGIVFSQPHHKLGEWYLDVQPHNNGAIGIPSVFAHTDVSNNRGRATASLNSQLKNLPVLIIHASHYDVYIPRA